MPKQNYYLQQLWVDNEIKRQKYIRDITVWIELNKENPKLQYRVESLQRELDVITRLRKRNNMPPPLVWPERRTYYPSAQSTKHVSSN